MEDGQRAVCERLIEQFFDYGHAGTLMPAGHEDVATQMNLEVGVNLSKAPVEQIGEPAFGPINQGGKMAIVIVNSGVQIHHIGHPGHLIQADGACELACVSALILCCAPRHHFQPQVSQRTVKDFTLPKLPGDQRTRQARVELSGHVLRQFLKDDKGDPLVAVGQSLKGPGRPVNTQAADDRLFQTCESRRERKKPFNTLL